jgi:protein TonB
MMMMTVVGDPDPRRPDLFADLMTPSPRSRRSALAAPVSLAVHGVALTLVVVFSVSRLEPPALKRDPLRIPLLGPPPAPMPQLPKGSGESQRPRIPAPDPRPVIAEFTAPVEAPPVDAPAPTAELPDTGGSPVGADDGIDEGSVLGKPGGQAGGVEWGQTGGVVDGTGEVPVRNPDQLPRLLQRVRPDYPHQAFVDKIEGTVVLEIVIDSTGRVAHTRLVVSIPALDAAAIDAVRRWVFAPAIKDGRPVATVATAPVRFQIH